MTKIKIGSLEHTALAYRDTDAAARWYCDLFGFEIAAQAVHPVHGVNFYFLKDPAGTGLLEIIPMPKGDSTKLRDFSNAHVHVAFDVADMDAAVAALSEVTGGADRSGATMLPGRSARVSCLP